MMNALDIGRIRNALARLELLVEYVTDLVFDDKGNVTGKGAGDQPIDAEVGYHWGFYSRPTDGTAGVFLKAGAKGGASFAVAFRGRSYEIALEKGEVAIASAFNTKLHFKKNGDADLVATGNVNIGTDTGLTAAVNGVVLGKGIDTFTGATYAALSSASTTVMAKP